MADTTREADMVTWALLHVPIGELARRMIRAEQHEQKLTTLLIAAQARITTLEAATRPLTGGYIPDWWEDTAQVEVPTTAGDVRRARALLVPEAAPDA